MSLTLILGPMFSGKSSELFRRLERYKCGGATSVVWLIKPTIDTRYEGAAKTHRGIELDCDTILYCDKICGFVEFLESEEVKPDVIGIDEGQFFPDLSEGIQKLIKMKIHCIVSALNGDFKQQPFKSVQEILGIFDTIVHLKAVCGIEGCRKEAPFTIRCGGGLEQVEVGLNYKPICRECLDAVKS